MQDYVAVVRLCAAHCPVGIMFRILVGWSALGHEILVVFLLVWSDVFCFIFVL